MAGRHLAGIVERADRIRGYGDFYHYHLLAAGKIEAVIESDVNILDIAALSIIVNEAGGVFTDLNGEPPTLGIRSVLAANPSLHAKVPGVCYEATSPDAMNRRVVRQLTASMGVAYSRLSRCSSSTSSVPPRSQRPSP